MALNVTGVPLEFTAVLNDNFSGGMAKITEELKQAANESGKTAEKFNKDFSAKLSGSLDKVSDSSKVGKNAIGQLTGSLTSLINPTALISAGLASAAIAIYKYSVNSSQAAKQQKILNDIIDQASKNYGNSAGKIDLLKDKLNDLSVPLKDRISYANDYNKVADKANQLDLTQISNLDAINPRIEAQIKLFKDRAIARAAETVVAQKAEAVFKAQLEFDTKFPEFSTKTVSNLTQAASDAINEAKKKLGLNGKININELLNFADLPDSELQQLAQKNDKFKILLDDRTKNILTNVNRQLKAVDEYKKGTKAGGSGAAIYQTIIDQKQNDLNQALDIASGLINPTATNTKGTSKSIAKSDPINSTLEERKRLIDEIISLQRDSDQSGLTKEQSALDKINETYDILIKKIIEYNSKVSKGEQIDITSLQAARIRQLQNTTYKENAKDYISSLGVQEKAFEDFENAKLQFGEAKAKELFGVQIAGADSYLDYLKKQKEEIDSAVSNQAGKANIQQTIELDVLNKKIQDETDKRTRDQVIQQFDNYRKLLQAAISYNEQKKAINDKYSKLEDEAFADKSASPEQTSLRIQILDEQRKKELDGVNETALKESDIYKKLNQDILGFTRGRIKDELAMAKKVLEDNKNGTANPLLKDNQGNQLVLPPEVVKSWQEYIKKLEEAGQKMETVVGLSADEWKKLSTELNSIGGAFNNLSRALQGTNDGLSATMDTMGDMINIAGDAASAVGSFMSGDIAGGISKTVSAITGIFSIGAKSRESERKAMEQLKAYQDSLITGQVSYNQLLRGQELSQGNINDLSIQELETRQKLLATQKQQAQADYDALLRQIKLEGNQITGEHTEKFGGVLGIGRKTRVVQELAGITDADYDNLLKLFTEKKLDEGTSKWFQELQKVHDELDSIGLSAQDVEQKQKELFTGTTSDAILDSIVQGFADGKRATADFADDFQNTMREAILNSFKYQALEKPIQDFYDQFAAASESDNTLTQSEIQTLQQQYDAIIKNAGLQFDQLTQLTGVDLSNSASSNTNTMSGAIQKQITEDTGTVIAGGIGGLRLTAMDQLRIATRSLDTLNKIEANTFRLVAVEGYLRKFDQQGIKIQ